MVELLVWCCEEKKNYGSMPPPKQRTSAFLQLDSGVQLLGASQHPKWEPVKSVTLQYPMMTSQSRNRK